MRQMTTTKVEFAPGFFRCSGCVVVLDSIGMCAAMTCFHEWDSPSFFGWVWLAFLFRVGLLFALFALTTDVNQERVANVDLLNVIALLATAAALARTLFVHTSTLIGGYVHLFVLCVQLVMTAYQIWIPCMLPVEWKEPDSVI